MVKARATCRQSWAQGAPQGLRPLRAPAESWEARLGIGWGSRDRRLHLAWACLPGEPYPASHSPVEGLLQSHFMDERTQVHGLGPRGPLSWPLTHLWKLGSVWGIPRGV